MRKVRTYIYMNDEIRKARPTKPVVVVQRGTKVRCGNTIPIRDRDGRVIGYVKFRRRGLRGAPYRVRAYVELIEATA